MEKGGDGSPLSTLGEGVGGEDGHLPVNDNPSLVERYLKFCRVEGGAVGIAVFFYVGVVVPGTAGIMLRDRIAVKHGGNPTLTL